MKAYKITLSNGFILSPDTDMPGTWWYYKRGVLCNRISTAGVENMTEPMRSEIRTAIFNLTAAHNQESRETFCQPRGYTGPYTKAQAIDLIAESDQWASDEENSRIGDLYRG